VADISVLTRLDASYTSAHVSDFAANAASGWLFTNATASTTTCSDFKLLGGFGVLAKGAMVERNVTNIAEHTLLTISFEFVKLDTWDGEQARLFVDDALVWTQSIGSTSGAALYGTANICGATTADAIIPVTITVPHDEAMAELRFSSTLDGGPTEESCTSVCTVCTVSAPGVGAGRLDAGTCVRCSLSVSPAVLSCAVVLIHIVPAFARA
jgi:hypothetical protein